MTTNVIIVIGVVVLIDLLLVPVLIVATVNAMWQPIVDAHPAVDPAPDAVTRNNQSFRVGPLNLAYAINVACDEAYLHLSPARWARFMRIRPASVPWSAIEIRKTGTRWMTARIAGKIVQGPRWCLELAGQGEEREASGEA